MSKYDLCQAMFASEWECRRCWRCIPGKKKERGHTDSDEEPEEVGSPSSKTSPSKRPQDRK